MLINGALQLSYKNPPSLENFQNVVRDFEWKIDHKIKVQSRLPNAQTWEREIIVRREARSSLVPTVPTAQRRAQRSSPTRTQQPNDVDNLLNDVGDECIHDDTRNTKIDVFEEQAVRPPKDDRSQA